MIINKVTITGADDSVNINSLINLSKKYPFVEWGILFSPKRKGVDRYPTQEWVKDLFKNNLNNKLNLSAHICGDYSYNLINGKESFFDKVEGNHIWSMFKRVQLNFNADKANINLSSLLHSLTSFNNEYNWNFIFQMNKSNSHLIQNVLLPYCKVEYFHYLFDGSGGNGILKEWQEPLKNVYCGYAGGLDTDNLENQLKLIEHKVGEGTIWVDVETGVRTNNKLDLEKVENFLQITSKYVK